MKWRGWVLKILYELPFNTEMAALSPRDFAKLILQESLGVSHVVVGAGRFVLVPGALGGPKIWFRWVKNLVFVVTVSQLLHTSGAEISSTAIRQALKEGRSPTRTTNAGSPSPN